MSTNNRASLLAGLRTGGVRSTSGSAVPHTAAPGASFQIPRFVSSSHSTANNANNLYQDEEIDYVADTLGQTLNINPSRRTTIPLTASAADAGVPKFQQLQQQAFLRRAANQGAPLNNNQQQQQAFLNQLQQMGPQAQAQAQAQLVQLWQMQQMQMQMMLAQQQQQQQQQQYQQEFNAPTQRPSLSGLRAPGRQQQPSTAGPMQTSFNLPQPTRPRVPQFEQPLSDDPGPVPMTAALGGKFGSRSLPAGLNGGFPSGEDDYKNYPVPSNPPMSASYQHTTVISGGTALGSGGGTQYNPPSVTPSKSDSAISWRRSGVNNSVLRNTPLRAATLANPPTVTISSPNGEDIDGSDHAPPAFTPIRTRPQPLRFNLPASNGHPTVTLDMTAGDGNPTQTIAINGNGIANDGSSSPSSGSLPPTPPSATSASSLSAREEASKKLYEGLGIGRPAPVPQQLQPQAQAMQYGSPNSMSIVAAAVAARAVSQPLRQPRGPPSGTEDFGAKNFASRIRRQAIGGLGTLMDARERREGGVEVEAY